MFCRSASSHVREGYGPAKGFVVKEDPSILELVSDPPVARFIEDLMLWKERAIRLGAAAEKL